MEPPTSASKPTFEAEHDRHRRPSRAHTFRKSLSVLYARRFGTFFFASLLSNIGTWAQQVAEPWLLLTLGASSFLVGLDNFALGAPVLLLTLIGGIMADRSDRRRVVAIFQFIQMLCPATLVVLLLTHAVLPWHVIALSVVVGITDALSMPSFQSIIPSIVAREQISAAVTLNATQFNLSRIIGPAIAGAVMVSLGAIGCFALNTLSYLPFIAVALWILPRRSARGGVDAPTQDINARSLLMGMQTIARRSKLRRALLTVLANSVLGGPLMTFCPVLVKQAFQGTATAFSIAIAVFGAGGVAGAVWLLGAEGRTDRGRRTTRFALAYAALIIVTALNPWSGMIAPLLFCCGLAMTASNISANAILQSDAAPNLVGQATSLYMIAMRGGISVGSVLTGVMIDHVGIRPGLAIDGALALAAQILIGGLWPPQAPAGSSTGGAG